jgi:hypothetical protein
VRRARPAATEREVPLNLDAIRFTVPTEPATKKTSQRVVRSGARLRIIPSERTMVWTRGARVYMARAMHGRPVLLGPVEVVYRFYRRQDRADLGGLEAAVDDAMQGVVIANDRQIRRRVSSVEVDKVIPRVEVEVWPVVP